jgi:hypothetical protein
MTMPANGEAGVIERADAVATLPPALVSAWRARALIPYIGPGALGLPGSVPVPASAAELVRRLVAKSPVPHRIGGRLTQAAQFIENFKHRRTLTRLMDEAFAAACPPSPLHRMIAALGPPVVVDTWYDDSMRTALADATSPGSWGEIQGLSQSEHFGTWTGAYDAEGAAAAAPDAAWTTILYKPVGSVAPAANYLVSDSDFVEVLTEIDVQTPIPPIVQQRRAGLPFLFVGCRFDDQLARSFARQIAKRSAAHHWAVLPEAPTRMESRFLAEQSIERLAMPLDAFVAALELALAAARPVPPSRP